MITVREFTTKERLEYAENKYNEFMHHYYNTNLTINDIFKKMGVNNRNNLAKYIRTKLRENNCNTNQRAKKIKNGEWI